jgi:long-chain acyl-CoA synthetase
VMPETLQELVEGLAGLGERPAVGLRQEFGVRWWSYARLSTETCRFADRLRRLGLPPGSRLLLWAPNCPEWVACLLGAALRGVVVVPADASASPQAVQRLASQVEACLVVHGPDQDVSAFPQPSQALFPQAPLAPQALFPQAPLAPQALAPQALQVPLAPGAPALILFTSGTTQEPRGVPLTHANLMVQVTPFRRWRTPLRLLPARMLVLSPLSHVQGLLLGVCLPLSLGLSVLYSVSLAPAHIARTLRQNRVTVLVAVPRLQHLLAEFLQRAPAGRSGLSLGERVRGMRPFLLRRHHLFLGTHTVLGYWFWILVVGGASLPEADERFWHESGYVLVQGYGLTETAALVSLNVDNPLRQRIGSIGKPLPHAHVRLAPDGEILVQGPHLSPACVPPGPPGSGFLATGDLGRFDRSGRLHFLGRKKEVIVTSEGHNVFPHEVEAVLNRMRGVREAVVVGRERDGQAEVHAVLWLEDDLQAGQIVRQANARLEPHQRIMSWSVWTGQDLPRTSLLKARRREIAATLEHPPAPAGERGAARPTLEQIREAGDRRERLRRLVGYLLEAPSTSSEGSRLRLVQDLGLSSLDLVELVALLARSGHDLQDEAALPEDISLQDLQAWLKGGSQAWNGHYEATRTPVNMDHPLLSLSRSILVPLVFPAWFALLARLHTEGRENLAGLQPPFIAACDHHENGSDVLAIYNALPSHLRKRFIVVTSHWIFRELLNPALEASLPRRAYVAFGFHFLLPLLFPYTLWPHYGATSHGIMETCRLIDRGYSPIVFPQGGWDEMSRGVQPGVALLAITTQVPILPMRLEGNEYMDFHVHCRRRDIILKFGKPIELRPQDTVSQVLGRLQAAFKTLAGGEACRL